MNGRLDRETGRGGVGAVSEDIDRTRMVRMVRIMVQCFMPIRSHRQKPQSEHRARQNHREKAVMGAANDGRQGGFQRW
jgi:hypothetical protein